MMNAHANRQLFGARRLFAIAAAAASAWIASVAVSNAEDLRRGPAVPLGKGEAHAWVSVGADGAPQALGVSISEEALDGIVALPATDLTLQLPAEAEATRFDHVYLNWTPHGHPPANVWDRPHFDVHFYMMTPAEREAISPEKPDFAEKSARHPEPKFIPANYMSDSEIVPGMGAHWADANTPELHGETFTHTLIYGSWDGQVRFIEPMVDLKAIETRETYTAPVLQPESVARAGMYPTSYRIDFDPTAGEHRVSIEGLTSRN